MFLCNNFRKGKFTLEVCEVPSRATFLCLVMLEFFKYEFTSYKFYFSKSKSLSTLGIKLG